MATQVGDIIQVVHFHKGQGDSSGTGRGKVLAVSGDKLTIWWALGGRGYLQIGRDQWQNLSR